MRQNIKIEEVTYVMAAPARKRDIIIWLLTGGRKGKLFVKNPTIFNKYSAPPTHFNCRSVILPIKKAKP